MAIRTRIIAVVVALVLLALGILDVTAYTVVRHSLIARADAELQAAKQPFFDALSSSPFAQNGQLCDGLPLNSFGGVYSIDGRALLGDSTCPSGNVPVPSSLPSSLVSAVRSSRKQVSASAHSFRLLADVLTTTAGRPVIFVVGEPLAPVNSTLGDLLLLEGIVSGSILVAVAAAGYFLVQLGLRPLERMAATAGEIAEGDLSRRVDDTDPRTEVGQLGRALNLMLTRIEEAFTDKEVSEQRLRRFIADASHELRTPLTSIRGYAELFRHHGLPDPTDLSTALRRIEGESTRMSGIVEDLLLLARLDQGRPLARAPVDLRAICEDVTSDAGVLAPDRRITFSGGEETVAFGDEARLRQVVMNLVSNALAHTPAGSPVEIEAEEEGDLARVSVVDHGPGVGEQEQAKVFDRFWRADESRQRSHGGSGLGLSIVAAVVAAHGGRVRVEETPGGGATFVVELPRGGRQEAEPAGAVANIRS